MNGQFKDARWFEILAGKRVWEREKICPGNRDKFQAEYVEPIEQLLSKRKIEEAKFNGLIQANKEVSEIRITGEVAAA